MKIRPGEAEMFQAGGHTDGQRHMTKLRVSFRHFVNAPKKEDIRMEKEMSLNKDNRILIWDYS